MKARGWTLVELLLTLVLVGILFAGTAWLIQAGLRSYVFLSDRALALQDLRYGLERMTRELKGVSLSGIQNVQSDRIQFVDSFGQATDFHWDSGTRILYRGSGKLLENVTEASWTAYKEDGSSTSAGPQVRKVLIQLQAAPEGGNNPVKVETQVFLRNYLYENFQ